MSGVFSRELVAVTAFTVPPRRMSRYGSAGGRRRGSSPSTISGPLFLLRSRRSRRAAGIADRARGPPRQLRGRKFTDGDSAATIGLAVSTLKSFRMTTCERMHLTNHLELRLFVARRSLRTSAHLCRSTSRDGIDCENSTYIVADILCSVESMPIGRRRIVRLIDSTSGSRFEMPSIEGFQRSACFVSEQIGTATGRSLRGTGEK